MSVADLEVEAARFARILSDVLNGSVCRDVQLETVIIAPDRSRDRGAQHRLRRTGMRCVTARGFRGFSTRCW